MQNHEGAAVIISRPVTDQGTCFYLVPSSRFPENTQLEVGEGDVGVFIKSGRVLATLAAGRHVLHASDFSFLRHLTKETSDGNVIETELLFVTTAQSHHIEYTGSAVPAGSRDHKIAFKAMLEYQIVIPIMAASWLLEVSPDALSEAIALFPPDELQEAAVLATAELLGEIEFHQYRDMVDDPKQLVSALQQVQSLAEAFGIKIQSLRLVEVGA